MRILSFASTDIGMKRKINQDAFLRDDALGLYVVADGMGGHRGGEVASRLAVDVIQSFCRDNRSLPPRERLDKAINLSCKEIHKEAQTHEELLGMGTTVLALLIENQVAYIGQVGDSRAYFMHGKGFWQITEDHSLMNEEIRAGRLSRDQLSTYQFKNVITRSVGYEDHVQVDVYRRKLKTNDLFLLCTDGLSGLVENKEIFEEIDKAGPETGLKSLISLANARGGDDNITALICQVVGS